MPRKTLSLEELQQPVMFDVDAGSIGDPASLALIRQALSEPDWKAHDLPNHGVTPSRAVEIMTGSLKMSQHLSDVDLDEAPES